LPISHSLFHHDLFDKNLVSKIISFETGVEPMIFRK